MVKALRGGAVPGLNDADGSSSAMDLGLSMRPVTSFVEIVERKCLAWRGNRDVGCAGERKGKFISRTSSFVFVRWVLKNRNKFFLEINVDVALSRLRCACASLLAAGGSDGKRSLGCSSSSRK